MNRRRFQRLWASPHWDVIVYPAYWLGRAFLVVGPWIVMAVVDVPPLWLGVVAAIAGLAWTAHIFVQGFYARFFAVHSANPLLQALSSRSWAVTVINVVRIAWLVPLVGVWGASIEHQLHASRDAPATTYSALGLWHAADSIPLVDLPTMLGQPTPPTVEWGAATGIALFVLAITVIWSLILVVTELITSRAAVRNRGSTVEFVDIDTFKFHTNQLQRGGSKRRSLLLQTFFVPILLIGTVPFRSTPESRHSLGMALAGGIIWVPTIGLVVALVSRQWGLAAIAAAAAAYWFLGAHLLEKEFRRRGYMPR